KEEFDEAYHRVMDSGWYLLGKETEAFEEEYARFCGVDHCVTVANGLDALVLTLRASGIGPGDEVIVPSHTFIATLLAVTQVGATPVPVEPDLATYNIDVTKIEQAVTSKTKAIIPVHLYGQPADMDPIMSIAEQHQLAVVEDAAQSQGAYYKGRRSGSLGHAAAHSFYPGKNLGAFSDGGAVTTNDKSIASEVRKLRNYGSQIKYQHEVAGINSRTDELQAAFLRIKLEHLDRWNARRQKIAEYYLHELCAAPELILPKVAEGTLPVWHLFVVRHAKRDQIQNLLKQQAIDTLIHYPIPAHCAQAYHHLEIPNGSFPIVEELSNSVLSLPIGPHQSSESTETIIQAIHSIA
ncbi:MAG: DegT/DnrJ/EryC1/StrS family aminotransferase, partial [Pirellulaceae bacterium]|nr:DegT/DnrJ/EryC1/StrS family aminotransferase [Pirellulaceae bacterium]